MAVDLPDPAVHEHKAEPGLIGPPHAPMMAWVARAPLHQVVLELVLDIRLPAEIRRKVTASRRARESAADAQRQATEKSALSALELVRQHGLSVRDAADLLGLSHQRVEQLVSAPPFDPDPELVTYLEGGSKDDAQKKFRHALKRPFGEN